MPPKMGEKVVPPRSDAYTGMLIISLVALAVGCAFLDLDYSAYTGKPPPVPANLPQLSAPPAGGQGGAGGAAGQAGAAGAAGMGGAAGMQAGGAQGARGGMAGMAGAGGMAGMQGGRP